MWSTAWRKMSTLFPSSLMNRTTKRPESESKQPEDDTEDTWSDILMVLPTEIIECIFEYVPLIDALIACHVSPVWNERLSSLGFWKKWAEPYVDRRTLESDTDWKQLCELVVRCLSKFREIGKDPSEHQMIDFSYFSVGVKALVSAYHSDYLLFVGDLHGRTNIQPRAVIYKYENVWTLISSFDTSPDEKMAVGCAMTRTKIVCTTDDGLVSFWSYDRLSNEVTKICERNKQCEGQVTYLVANDELDLVLLVGTDKINLWDLNTGSVLRSFPTLFPNDTRKVDILTGDKSPFVGYHCVYIDELYTDTESMYFWGQDIPLENALHTKFTRIFDKYGNNQTQVQCFVPDEAFFDEGNLIYGLSQYCSPTQQIEDDVSTRWTKIIREPFTIQDFVISGPDTISDNTIATFRDSLHPCTGSNESSATLRKQFSTSVFEVGRIFTLFEDENGQTCLACNATGDWDEVVTRIGFMVYLRQLCDLEWLHGLNNIRPGKALAVFGGIKCTIMLSWKPDILKQLSLAELLDARNNQNEGLLASLGRFQK